MERSKQRPQAENYKCVGVKEGTLGNMGSEGVREIMGGHFGKYGIRTGTGNNGTGPNHLHSSLSPTKPHHPAPHHRKSINTPPRPPSISRLRDIRQTSTHCPSTIPSEGVPLALKKYLIYQHELNHRTVSRL